MLYHSVMANPTRITRSGDALTVYMDDGTQRRAAPTNGSTWILGQGRVGTPDPDPGSGGGGGPVTPGEWQWPFQYSVYVFQPPNPIAPLTQFNPARRNPVSGIVRPHTGLDFGAGGINGKQIPSAHDGVVEISASPSAPYFGYGAAILIRHPDGTACLYAHRQQKFLNVGDKVTKGQNLGLVGATGNVTGPHLHWETWEKNNVKVNPRQFMKDRGVKET